MATAEVGALRVSLSLDSAAFTAGTRAATSSAQVASTTIATSFQTASTRVSASLATMSAAMTTQFRAGMMQQIGQLRTGLLGLISPVGLLIGAASYGLTALIGRQSDAGEAARVHADMVDRLNKEVDEARNKSPEYIQARQNEAAADLDAAQAAVAVARGRVAAARAAFQSAREGALAETDPLLIALQGAFGVGTGGELRDLNDELEAQLAVLEEREGLVAALEQQIVQLRAQQRRSWMIQTVGGGTLPGAPAVEPPDEPAEEALSKLSDAQAAILEKVRDFEARQTELVRQGEEQRRALREAALSSVASIFGSLAKIVGDGSERAFKISKGFALTEAGINTMQAITKALASAAPPFNFINAAAVGAAGAAQIAGILRAQPGSASVPAVGGAPATGGSTEGGAAAAGSAGHAVNITLMGDSWGRQQTKALIERINAEVRDGAKLITVS